MQGQYARDAGTVHAALKALGLSKLAELQEALERLAAADKLVAEARAGLAEWEADAQTTDAIAERSKVEEEMRAVEARLSEQAGGFVRDVQSVEAELVRVRGRGGGALQPGPGPGAAPRARPGDARRRAAARPAGAGGGRAGRQPGLGGARPGRQGLPGGGRLHPQPAHRGERRRPGQRPGGDRRALGRRP